MQNFNLVSECMEKHYFGTKESLLFIFMSYKLSLMTGGTERKVMWQGEFNECGKSKDKGVTRVLEQEDKKGLPYLISCIEIHVLVILKDVGDHLRPRHVLI